MLVNCGKIERNTCSETPCEKFREAEPVSFHLVNCRLPSNGPPVWALPPSRFTPRRKEKEGFEQEERRMLCKSTLWWVKGFGLETTTEVSINKRRWKKEVTSEKGIWKGLRSGLKMHIAELNKGKGSINRSAWSWAILIGNNPSVRTIRKILAWISCYYMKLNQNIQAMHGKKSKQWWSLFRDLCGFF